MTPPPIIPPTTVHQTLAVLQYSLPHRLSFRPCPPKREIYTVSRFMSRRRRVATVGRSCVRGRSHRHCARLKYWPSAVGHVGKWVTHSPRPIIVIPSCLHAPLHRRLCYVKTTTTTSKGTLYSSVLC